jgi:2-haloacid dehalogenase
MDIDGITHVSFDCYGTLIDWEAGILAAALPALAAAGAKGVTPESLLRLYARHESAVESGGWRPYREVLAEVLRRIGVDFTATVDAAACAHFAASVGEWPPFADSVAALARLASRFKLVILSNVDDDLFAGSARQLGAPFEAVITAQQVRSYKPGLAHFHAARDRLGLDAGNWLHVAQSLYHDHVPARSLGLRTVHVDRPSRLAGTGVAPLASVQPTARTTTMAEVADLLRV